MNEVQKTYQNAKNLFYFSRIEKTMKEEMKKADIKSALIIIIVSGLLTLLISLGILIEQFYFVNYASDVASEVLSEYFALISWEEIIPYGMFELVFKFPFMVLFFFIYEGIVYYIMKLTGGKGTLEQQLHLSALVALSMAMMSCIGFLLPLPCMNVMAVIALIILTPYFLLYVNVKVYEIVHGVSFLHSLTVVILLLIPRYWIMFVVTGTFASFLGLPQQIDLSGVVYGV